MSKLSNYIKNMEGENKRAIIIPIYFLFTMLFDMIPRMILAGYGKRLFIKEFWINNYAILKVLLCGNLKDGK